MIKIITVLAALFVTGCVTTATPPPSCQSSMDEATKGLTYVNSGILSEDAQLYVFARPNGEAVGFVMERGPGAEKTKQNDKFAFVETCMSGEDVVSIFLYVGEDDAGI